LQDGDHPRRAAEAAAQVDDQVEQPGQAEGEAEESAHVTPVGREAVIRTGINRHILHLLFFS
jgi:hypothetical protein